MRSSLIAAAKLVGVCGCLAFVAGCEPQVQTSGDESPASTGNTPDTTSTTPSMNTGDVARPGDQGSSGQTDVSIDLNRNRDAAAGDRPRIGERLGGAVDNVEVQAGDGAANVTVE